MAALPKLSRLKPIVWTIHDAWPTTGVCVHSFECERWLTNCQGICPHPWGRSPLRHYTPALHWRFKQTVYQQIDVTLVAASQWTLDRVRRSPLLRHFPCQLIPFGVNLKKFAPQPRVECRQRLGIPLDHHVLAFRGNGIGNDLYKGMRSLQQALTLYQPSRPTCLLIFDDGQDFESFAGKYKVIDLGWVNEDMLVDALCASDVFLMPSLQESFGLMAVEAMACGIPVITFDGTAIPSVIKAPQAGLAIPSGDSVLLAAAVERLLGDSDLREAMGREGRLIAEREYSSQLYIQRHLDLYRTVFDRHK